MELGAREALEEHRKAMQEYLDDMATLECWRAMDMEYRLDQAEGFRN